MANAYAHTFQVRWQIWERWGLNAYFRQNLTFWNFHTFIYMLTLMDVGQGKGEEGGWRLRMEGEFTAESCFLMQLQDSVWAELGSKLAPHSSRPYSPPILPPPVSLLLTWSIFSHCQWAFSTLAHFPCPPSILKFFLKSQTGVRGNSHFGKLVLFTRSVCAYDPTEKTTIWANDHN